MKKVSISSTFYMLLCTSNFLIGGGVIKKLPNANLIQFVHLLGMQAKNWKIYFLNTYTKPCDLPQFKYVIVKPWYRIKCFRLCTENICDSIQNVIVFHSVTVVFLVSTKSYPSTLLGILFFKCDFSKIFDNFTGNLKKFIYATVYDLPWPKCGRKPTTYNISCEIVYCKYTIFDVSYIRLYATCRCYSQVNGRVAGLYLILWFNKGNFEDGGIGAILWLRFELNGCENFRCEPLTNNLCKFM